MRRYIIFGIICSAVFLVTSCGKQHKAESVVKDFLDKNMTTSDYSISFNEIDSTRHLTDSMINVMKSNARKYNLFKKEIAYDISTNDKPYMFMRTKICSGKDTVAYTFYIDKTLQNIIAFKRN